LTALDRTPINTNLLQPDGFQIAIKRLKTVTFFTQQINIPGFILPPTSINNPFIEIPIPGDHIQFDDLTFTFKVDEDFRNYMEIYNWINGLGYPDDYSQYKTLADADKEKFRNDGIKSDISVLIMTNLKNANLEVLFREAFPISLGGFNFDTTDNSLTEISTEVTFKYEKFDITVLPR
jgi:T4-like virus tail tube protein gp19.